VLIADGADIKTVQTRLRHGSATTTLPTYTPLAGQGRVDPGVTVGAVIAARTASAGERSANGGGVD
jgi:hypothetical protein